MNRSLPRRSWTSRSWSGSYGVAVRFLDNVIDVSRFPLPAQRQEAFQKRRIGLGITGLSNALTLCRVRYASWHSLSLIERWLTILRDSAYDRVSATRSREGRIPAVRPRSLSGSAEHPFASEAIREKIGRSGIRNGLLTSIAPTGTISLFAGKFRAESSPCSQIRYGEISWMRTTPVAEERSSDFAYRQVSGDVRSGSRTAGIFRFDA